MLSNDLFIEYNFGKVSFTDLYNFTSNHEYLRHLLPKLNTSENSPFICINELCTGRIYYLENNTWQYHNICCPYCSFCNNLNNYISEIREGKKFDFDLKYLENILGNRYEDKKKSWVKELSEYYYNYKSKFNEYNEDVIDYINFISKKHDIKKIKIVNYLRSYIYPYYYVQFNYYPQLKEENKMEIRLELKNHISSKYPSASISKKLAINIRTVNEYLRKINGNNI